jgi:chorismate mutase
VSVISAERSGPTTTRRRRDRRCARGGYTRFGQWKLDPDRAPTAAQDLSASRATIDRLNHAMVSEMARHWDVLRSPECSGLLDDARRDVIAASALDEIYQQALFLATRAYC